MPSPAFGHQAHKPWMSSWAREAQMASIPLLWPHAATRVPGLSFLALPPTCSTATHRPPTPANSQCLLSICCVPGIALGAGKGVVSEVEAAHALRELVVQGRWRSGQES